MTDTSSSSSYTKKCPHCQGWSSWNQRPNDRCDCCGKFLDPRGQQYAEQQAQQASEPNSTPTFKIQPDDGAVVRFFKRMGRAGQIVFGALLALFIAIVTFAAG